MRLSLALLTACGIGGTDPGPRIFSGTFRSSLTHEQTIERVLESLERSSLSPEPGYNTGPRNTALYHWEDGFRVSVIVKAFGKEKRWVRVSMTGFHDAARIKPPLGFFFMAEDGPESMNHPTARALTAKFNAFHTDLRADPAIDAVLQYSADGCVTYRGEMTTPC